MHFLVGVDDYELNLTTIMGSLKIQTIRRFVLILNRHSNSLIHSAFTNILRTAVLNQKKKTQQAIQVNIWLIVVPIESISKKSIHCNACSDHLV